MNSLFNLIKGESDAEKAANKSGKLLGDAFASGFFSAKFSEKIKSWRDSVLEHIKTAFQGADSAKILRDDVAGYLSTALSGGLKANSKSVVKAFSGMLEKLKYQRDFDLISEAEYYRELEALRDKYFAKGTENWVKYTQQIYAYQKEALENEMAGLKKKYDELAEYAEKKVNEIFQKQERFAREMGSGVLFKTNTVRMNGETDVYYSLFDFDGDIKAIREYTDMLSRLEGKFKELGVEAAGDVIFSYLSEMDWESAYGYMSAIMKSSDYEIKDYAENLLLKESVARGASAKHFEREIEAVLTETFDTIKAELTNEASDISEEFFKSGSVSAEQFGEAFLKEFDVQLENIRAKIEEFNASLTVTSDNSTGGGNVYNTNNNSYNIQTNSVFEATDFLKRIRMFTRLSGS